MEKLNLGPKVVTHSTLEEIFVDVEIDKLDSDEPESNEMDKI